jgi:hypothetical protein
MPERATMSNRSEESAEVVVVLGETQQGRRPTAKDRTRRNVQGREYAKGHASDVSES